MKRVPELRFKEFDGEWEEKRLGELVEMKGGFAFQSKNFKSVKSKYQVIRMSNLYKNDLLLDRNPCYLEEISEKEKEYLLRKGDIIITLTGTVGKRDFGYSYQISEEDNLLLNQRLALIRVKETDSFFLKEIFLKEKFLDQFFESSVGGTGNQANVSIKNMQEFKLNTTNIKEQEKIADFLSIIDNKISLTEEKLENLKNYKKGIMQKIFSQEIRFKNDEGGDYSDWKEKKLKDIVFKIKNGISLEQNSKMMGYKVTRIETISKGKVDINRIGFVKTTKDIEDYKLIEGDLLFSNINSVEHIGKIAYVDYDYNLYHGMNLLKIRFLNTMSSKYFYYLLTSRDYKKYFETICNKAVSQASINQSSLEKTKMLIPSLLEQQKIATFLTSLDDKISNIENSLEELKIYKKGLLQKMFI